MEFMCQVPGKKSKAIISRDSRVVAGCLTREYSVVFEKAKGVNIWDADGKKYLDMMACVAVMNVGHSNPDVLRAVKRQVEKGTHCGFSDLYAEKPVEFCEELLTLLPKNMGSIFLSNSGTESVEAAYKIARWHSSKKWVIAFENSFHGRTMGSLSMTKSKPVHRERFAPFLPVEHVPFPHFYRMGMEAEECSNYCLDRIEKAMKKHKGSTAAMFIEAVQGEGGYIVPPKNFFRGVRKLCNEHGVLLCDDEVQAGCYRTGKFLAIENFGVKPDVISMSKSVGGGLPLGATAAPKRLDRWPKGAHANTFGGNLVSCAAGLATLRFLKKKRLGDNAKRVGSSIMKRLEEIRDSYECVGDVRGLGLMIGVEIVRDKKSRKPDKKMQKSIICECVRQGVLFLPAGKSSIRIAPPLIITESQAIKGIDVFEKAIRKVSR